MKKIFLESFGGGVGRIDGVRCPCEFTRDNGHYELLKEKLPSTINCMIVASDPANHEYLDETAALLTEGFRMDGFNPGRLDVCDGRNAHEIIRYLNDYNVIFLTGGHVPTQNRFFHEIGLKERLIGYDGVIIGRSAGAMNCARIVYAQPEAPGEAVDPAFARYIDGLALTEISILPHFDRLEPALDGLDIIEDICLPDSMVRPFYTLTDRSFIYIENGRATVYGESYLFAGGKCELVCRDGESAII